MNIIEINSSNYTEFKSLSVVALSFTKLGGQGEKGCIKIMDKNGILYHSNIIKTIKLEEVFTVCTFLRKCDLNLFNAKVPDGWCSFYMGGGNFLIVKGQFKEVIESGIPKGLYNNWIDILHNAIKGRTI